LCMKSCKPKMENMGKDILNQIKKASNARVL